MVCTFFNDSWEQCKLNDLGVSTSGTSIESEFSDEGVYNVISIGSYSEDSIYNDQGIKAIHSSKTENRVLDEGDLTMILNDKTQAGRILGRVLLIEKSSKYVYNQRTQRIQPYKNKFSSEFLYHLLNATLVRNKIIKQSQGNTQIYVNWSAIKETEYFVPNLVEQEKLGQMFSKINDLITLHQRECIINGGEMKQVNKNTLLVDYYEQWINVYKEGAIRNVTMKKYRLTLLWLKKIAPKLKLCKLDRIEYQNILNTYALEHERQTTMDFHHQLKGAILDAVDEGYIERDPTRKVIIKGKTPRAKKIKYLNQYELHTLLKNLDLSHGVNFDWLILIIAKTGMRFSEAIALTPKDFDFSHQTLSINKTWDYKESGTFQPTKNKSSVRKIQIDWMVVSQFSTLIKDLPENEPIFVKKPIYNSTINDILKRHCKKNKIPIITVHGLRHTHASLLLFAGVSIASVAQRLGHASMTTTQKTYLHIIQELENKDVDLVMRSLSGLC